jgi:hypothetical protein
MKTKKLIVFGLLFYICIGITLISDISALNPRSSVSPAPPPSYSNVPITVTFLNPNDTLVYGESFIVNWTLTWNQSQVNTVKLTYYTLLDVTYPTESKILWNDYSVDITNASTSYEDFIPLEERQNGIQLAFNLSFTYIYAPDNVQANGINTMVSIVQTFIWGGDSPPITDAFSQWLNQNWIVVVIIIGAIGGIIAFVYLRKSEIPKYCNQPNQYNPNVLNMVADPTCREKYFKKYKTYPENVNPYPPSYPNVPPAYPNPIPQYSPYPQYYPPSPYPPSNDSTQTFPNPMPINPNPIQPPPINDMQSPLEPTAKPFETLSKEEQGEFKTTLKKQLQKGEYEHI